GAVQTFAAQEGTQLALAAAIGLSDDAALVLGGEEAPLGPLEDLGVQGWRRRCRRGFPPAIGVAGPYVALRLVPLRLATLACAALACAPLRARQRRPPSRAPPGRLRCGLDAPLQAA